MLVKTLERSGIFGSKILRKNSRQWGIYNPNTKTSRWLIFQPETAGGRPPGRPPTVIFLTVGSLRSTGRSTVKKTESKALWSVDRPVDRPKNLANVHWSVHVGRPTLGPGRPTLGPGRPAGRPPEPGSMVLGQKTGFKIILKILIKLLKIHKNSF